MDRYVLANDRFVYTIHQNGMRELSDRSIPRSPRVVAVLSKPEPKRMNESINRRRPNYLVVVGWYEQARALAPHCIARLP